MEQPTRREREDLGAVLRQADRMLELRRERLVAGHRRPVVGENLGLGAAEVDHRLNGEEHAGLQRGAGAGAAVASTKVWMAWPISPNVFPGFTASMPLKSASCVTWISRSAFRLSFPATYIRLVSPNQPSRITVTSMFRISPSFSVLRSGSPCSRSWPKSRPPPRQAA